MGTILHKVRRIRISHKKHVSQRIEVLDPAILNITLREMNI